MWICLGAISQPTIGGQYYICMFLVSIMDLCLILQERTITGYLNSEAHWRQAGNENTRSGVENNGKW